ncbi:MAG: hypothetical protein Q9214_000313 [Letrouitia sp. 1 TL-2023]
MVKRPLLALRFQLPENQVKRIQLHFDPETGFDAAMTYLEPLRLPVIDKEASTAQPPIREHQPSSTRSWQPHETDLPPLSQRIAYQNLQGPTYNTLIEQPKTLYYPLPSPTKTYTGDLEILHEVPNHYFQETAVKGFKPSVDVSQYVQIPCYEHSSTHDQERETSSNGFSLPFSSAPVKASERPVTAPLTLSQLIPPKRELPFPKLVPKSAVQRQEDLLEIQTTEQTIGLQSLEKKTKVQHKAIAKNTNAKVSSLKSLNTGSSPPTASESPLIDPTLVKPPIAPIKQAPKRPPTRAPPNSPPHNKKKLASPSKPVATLEAKSQTEPFANISPEEYMDRLNGWVRKCRAFPTSISPQMLDDREQLAKFSALPDDERLKVIDDMIVQCLDDENFVKLVEDVERCWKRIGLGF